MTRGGMRELTLDAIGRLGVQETDSRGFRAGVLERLRRAMGFDWYAWVLTDPSTTVGVDPFAQVPDLADLPRVVRLKYLTAMNRWTSLETGAALGDHAVDSLLWRDVQRIHGVVDVASVVFRDRFGCWGFLDLWSKRPYAAKDVALLRHIAPAVTTGLRRYQARTFTIVAAVTPSPSPGPWCYCWAKT